LQGRLQGTAGLFCRVLQGIAGVWFAWCCRVLQGRFARYCRVRAGTLQDVAGGAARSWGEGRERGIRKQHRTRSRPPPPRGRAVVLQGIAGYCRVVCRVVCRVLQGIAGSFCRVLQGIAGSFCRVLQGIAGVWFAGYCRVVQGCFAGYCRVLQGPRGVFAPPLCRVLQGARRGPGERVGRGVITKLAEETL